MNPSNGQHGQEPERNSTVAFLLSRYPAISHTFFLKEVLGLRERGLDVRVASINAPDRPQKDLPPIEAAEAEKTYYIKSAGAVKTLLKLGFIAILHPASVFRGLAAALALGGWDWKARIFAMFYLAEALLVGDWMNRQSLEHLHVHFGGPVATVGMLTAKAWNKTWSITLHGPDEFFDQDYFYLAQKIDSASFVICISDFCRSQVLRIVPQLDEGRVEVVRLGVDCTNLNPPALADVSTSRTLRLVCTGRMVAAKGHRILFKAIAQCLPVLNAADVELSCDLIGDGPERSNLEQYADRLGISKVVQFLGARSHDQTLSLVALADIFVLASFAEGLPVALMEAMALGIPCVSTTIAAIPELIKNGENGLLVSPANPSALGHALAKLAQDPQLRLRFGRAARATVESEYNLSINLDTLASLWKRRLIRDNVRH